MGNCFCASEESTFYNGGDNKNFRVASCLEGDEDFKAEGNNEPLTDKVDVDDTAGPTKKAAMDSETIAHLPDFPENTEESSHCDQQDKEILTDDPDALTKNSDSRQDTEDTGNADGDPSPPVDAKESARSNKLARLVSEPGFFVALDQRSSKALNKQLGLDGTTTSSDAVKEALHQIHMRIIADQRFEASKVLGVFITRDTLEQHIRETRVVNYLSEEKHLVTILDIENALAPVKKGVQLIDMTQSFEDVLQAAIAHGIFAAKIHSVVRSPNAEGIAALVGQQFEIAKHIIAKGLLPVLQIIVDIKVSDKNNMSREMALTERRKSEEILFGHLLAALGKLPPDERVIFEFMLPAKQNTYLSLIGHPNTVRVLAKPASTSLTEACKSLERNFGLVAAFGNILMEGMSLTQEDSEFASTLEATLEKVYAASIAVPTKEMQTTKVAHGTGFFACLDSTTNEIEKALSRYRLGSRSDYSSEAAMLDKVHEMRSRILSNPKLLGSRVIGVVMSAHTMQNSVCSKPTARYLWEEKQIVPFLTLEHEYLEEKDGVALMKDIPNLNQLLSKAVSAGVYGINALSLIKKPNPTGIQAAVSHHIKFSLKVMKKDLVPILHVEVDKDATDKATCDELLCEILGRRLEHFRPEQKVILWVSPPQNANLFLPLRGHPNVILIVFASAGNDRAQCCRLLQDNFGAIGGFNRAFVEGMHYEQTDDELTARVDESCQAIYESSRPPPPKTIQRYLATKQHGIFVALAHIAAKTEHSIAARVRYGASDEGELQALFERIVTNPQFNSLHVLGVSLTSENLARPVMGMPIAKYLWEEKAMMSFLKVDVRGFAKENNGVRLMQELPQHQHESLLDMAVNAGIFGVTALSIIVRPDSKGIREVVDQQVRWAKLAIVKGLVPILMIFIDKQDSVDPGRCEHLLRGTLLSALGKLESHEEVIVNVVLPVTQGVYEKVLRHPRVLRVLGSAGSNSYADAIKILSENDGIIANFGTSLMDRLRKNQTYSEFSKALGQTFEQVRKSSQYIEAPFSPTYSISSVKYSPTSPISPASPKF